MTSEEYNDDLWHEIPQAYIGLGQRGREAVPLRQCYIPSCNAQDPDTVHIIEKEESPEEETKPGYTRQSTKYKVHCETCGGDFYLVFDKSTHDQEDGESVSMQRVHATDIDGTNYGELGFA